jgi:hypothetical protein
MEWCTVKEFLRISSEFGNLSARTIQRIIKQGIFHLPVKKILGYGFVETYLIGIEDPVAIQKLSRLRAVRQATSQAMKKIGLTVEGEKEKDRVNIKLSKENAFFSSGYNRVLPGFFDYVKDLPEDTTIIINRIKPTFIRVRHEVYEKLKRIAENSKCSIGEVFIKLHLDYEHTEQGKAGVAFYKTLPLVVENKNNGGKDNEILLSEN